MTSLGFWLTYKDDNPEVSTDLQGWRAWGFDWPTRMTSLRFRLTYKDDEPEVSTDLQGWRSRGFDWPTRMTIQRFWLTYKDDDPEVSTDLQGWRAWGCVSALPRSARPGVGDPGHPSPRKRQWKFPPSNRWFRAGNIKRIFLSQKYFQRA